MFVDHALHGWISSHTCCIEPQQFVTHSDVPVFPPHLVCNHGFGQQLAKCAGIWHVCSQPTAFAAKTCPVTTKPGFQFKVSANTNPVNACITSFVNKAKRSTSNIGSFLALTRPLSTCTMQEPLVTFTSATASSTYHDMPSFSPKRALDPGSGYWCSDGNHAPDQVVRWTGVLSARHQVTGLKINWAYSPNEMKVLTSLDGESFEDATCWQAALSKNVSYEQSIMFDSPRNVKAVQLAMRGPKAWQYFGIDDAALLVAPSQPVMLINGITAKPNEQCLVALDEFRLGLAPCPASIDASDTHSVFRFNLEGQLEHIDDGKCVVVAGGLPGTGGIATLDDCEEALRYDDGRSQWYITQHGQLKQSKADNNCLVPMGSNAFAMNCDKASQAIDARDRWFLSAVTQDAGPTLAAA